MNKWIKRFLYSILIIFILGIIIYPKLPESAPDEVPAANNSQQASDDLLTVQAIVLDRQELLNNVRITGSIQADETVDLNAEVSAIVEGIFFKEGQKINKGDLLVTLKDDELQAELEKLQFTKKLNEDNEYRQRQLLEKEAISQEEYDNALNELNTSEAEIRVVRARIDKHRITAPFDGVIGLREISVGSYMNPGNLIARFYKIDPVKIDFSIPGRYLSKIDEGDRLLFTVDAYADTFEGEIYAIEPRVDPDTRNIKIRAICPNPDNRLIPGQFAKINLILEKINDALMVPTEAVIPELDGKKVFVYKNGLVSSRKIETGIRTEKNIEVVKGLAPSDTVITSGILQIRTGMPVNVSL
jgi:membrane fusion protein (multidrug efflux system)